MRRQFSHFIALGCTTILIGTPLVAVYLLFNIDSIAELVKTNVDLPIQWETLTDAQLYGFWTLTVLYVFTGLAGLYFLRRAFSNFAKGELFNFSNSRDLRIFSMFLFAQALLKPLHSMASSLILSINHPPGERFISITLGSVEFTVIALAMILWVMSDLLINANQLESENKQFV